MRKQSVFVWYSKLMFYLIGGPPRMGKSTLAQQLLDEEKIPYVSSDGLTVMLKPAGQPSFYSPQKADQFYPYLELFMDRMQTVGPQYTIEGDAFSPQHVAALSKKHEIKSIFLVMKEIRKADILNFLQHDTWASKISSAQLDNLVLRIKRASKDLEEECIKYDIACVDLSKDYLHSLSRAKAILLSE